MSLKLIPLIMIVQCNNNVNGDDSDSDKGDFVNDYDNDYGKKIKSCNDGDKNVDNYNNNNDVCNYPYSY